ncbi:MAG TPA: SHOCT domain-containing protein [Methanomicrobiales archaeon]|nr:SHOCT domain-containing protein [Methanomicrobiales archaeon]
MMRRTIHRTELANGMVAVPVSGTNEAIKLSQADVQKIEQHTGKKVETLSEAELDKAMDDLGIQEQELTDTDVSQVEAQMQKEETAAAKPAAAPAPAAAPKPAVAPTAPSAPSQTSYLDELERLGQLKDKGIISEDEFEAKKKELLGL